MIENHTEKTSYTWLILITVLSSLAMFSAGFDHDVVFYGVFLMSVFFVAHLLLTKEPLKLNSVIISFLILIGWSYISIVWSISPIRTVIEGIQFFSFALVYLLARKLTSEELDKFFKILFLVTGSIAVLGLLEYVFISGSRIHTTFTNPNPFGIYMVMMFLVALSMAIMKENKVVSTFSVLFLSVVFLSGSRASLGAMAVAMIIVFVGIEKTVRKKALIKASMIFILAFLFSQILLYLSVFIRQNVFVDVSLLESITRSSSFVTSSLKGRLEFWRVAFELFRNKPLTGYGQGTYFSAYYIEYGMNEWYTRFTHNHYLQVLSELGIVGLVMFLWFIWNGFKAVVYNAKQSSKAIAFWGMVAAMVAFLLHIGVDFTWNFPAVTALFFFFLGVATRVDQKEPLKVSKTISLVALGLIIVITGWQWGSAKLYMKAIDLEQTDSIESALRLTEKINSVYPISSFGWSYESDLHYKKYLTTQNQENIDKSFVAAEKAINNGPYDAGINTKMAKLYQNIGNYDNAEMYYLTATRYSAYVLSSFVELGNMYIEMGEKDKAIQILLSALDRSPYAIKSASSDTRESVVDTVAIIHLTLANLFNEAGEEEKLQGQLKELIALKEVYPFLEKYFK